MSHTVSLAVIVMMNAVLALLMAMSLTGGNGSAGVSRSFLGHIVPNAVEAPRSTPSTPSAGGFVLPTVPGSR
jgi:hypothetical protein